MAIRLNCVLKTAKTLHRFSMKTRRVKGSGRTSVSCKAWRNT